MSDTTPPHERDTPYFEIGRRRVFYDGSHNWIVDTLKTREDDEGSEETYWADRKHAPNPKIAFKRAARGTLEDQDTGGIEEILEAFRRIEKTIAELSDEVDRPDLEDVDPYELPLPHRDS